MLHGSAFEQVPDTPQVERPPSSYSSKCAYIGHAADFHTFLEFATLEYEGDTEEEKDASPCNRHALLRTMVHHKCLRTFMVGCPVSANSSGVIIMLTHTRSIIDDIILNTLSPTFKRLLFTVPVQQ